VAPFYLLSYLFEVLITRSAVVTFCVLAGTIVLWVFLFFCLQLKYDFLVIAMGLQLNYGQV